MIVTGQARPDQSIRRKENLGMRLPNQSTSVCYPVSVTTKPVHSDGGGVIYAAFTAATMPVGSQQHSLYCPERWTAQTGMLAQPGQGREPATCDGLTGNTCWKTQSGQCVCTDTFAAIPH